MKEFDFIVTGDWHFGEGYLYGKYDKDTGVNSFLSDKIKSVNQIIKFCKNNEVKTAVITGDIFKEGNGSADQVRRELFSVKIKELADVVDNVVLIVGNHDIYGNTNIYSDINVWTPENVKIYDKAEYIEDLNIVVLPYFNIKSVYNYDKSKEFNNITISEAMKEIVLSIYNTIPEDKINTTKCFFHFTLSEAEYREGVLTKWGHDIILSSSLLDDLFEISVGGHLHEPQKIGNSCYYHGGITQSEINQSDRSFIAIKDSDIKRISLVHRKIHSIKVNTIKEVLDKIALIDKNDCIVIDILSPKSDFGIEEIKELESECGKFHRYFIKYKFKKSSVSNEDFKILEKKNKNDIDIISNFIKDKEKKKNIIKVIKKYEIFS